jgi:hypothetical protein
MIKLEGKQSFESSPVRRLHKKNLLNRSISTMQFKYKKFVLKHIVNRR